MQIAVFELYNTQILFLFHLNFVDSDLEYQTSRIIAELTNFKICIHIFFVHKLLIISLTDRVLIITFDSVESATRAKETLHGADIYSGCCTLKIDFAKVST